MCLRTTVLFRLRSLLLRGLGILDFQIPEMLLALGYTFKFDD